MYLFTSTTKAKLGTNIHWDLGYIIMRLSMFITSVFKWLCWILRRIQTKIIQFIVKTTLNNVAVNDQWYCWLVSSWFLEFCLTVILKWFLNWLVRSKKRSSRENTHIHHTPLTLHHSHYCTTVWFWLSFLWNWHFSKKLWFFCGPKCFVSCLVFVLSCLWHVFMSHVRRVLLDLWHCGCFVFSRYSDRCRKRSHVSLSVCICVFSMVGVVVGVSFGRS